MLLQDMNTISTDLSSMADADATAARANPPPPPGAPPSQSTDSSDSTAATTSDITNTGTMASTPHWHRGWDATPGAGDQWQQQAGIAAYSASSMAGLTSATTATLQGISA
jgi:hypothetical protein